MAFYESTFITRQDISTQDVEKLREKFSAIVKDNGGKVAKHEYWGLRPLAYEIKKNKKGHYVMLVLEADSGEVLKELERNYRLSEDVIRFLTVNIPEIKKEPSLMLRVGKDRDDADELAA